MILQIKKLRENAVLPLRATGGSVGYDLCAALEEPVTLNPGETKPVPTGLAMAIPEGYGGFLFARSGLAVKHGIAPANCVGVIDSDYRGPLGVALYNLNPTPYIVQPGDRIAQLMVVPVVRESIEVVDELPPTSRGEGGFGSTGR